MYKCVYILKTEFLPKNNKEDITVEKEAKCMSRQFSQGKTWMANKHYEREKLGKYELFKETLCLT